MLSSPTETRMPSHRRCRGPPGGSCRSPARADACHHNPSPPSPPPPQTKRISATDRDRTEILGQGLSKRSSSTSLSSPTSCPSWVILNRVGARKDSFRGDGTTSAVSCTSAGEQISVSFELVRPPRTSLLTLDWPQGPRPSEGTTSNPHVIAAHRNVVLFEIITAAKYPRPAAVDYFVYKATEDPPSLTRLPVCYLKGTSDGGSPRPRIMSREAMGIVSCSDDSFIVADLARSRRSSAAVDIYIFCSGANNWKTLRDIPVHGYCGSELAWWSTDVVLAYRDRYLIWVDYLRGMILASMTHHSGSDLQYVRYVRLPVDPPKGDPYDSDYGRGCPEATRTLCATHHGIKFVSINQHGIITLWSLLKDESWREDAAFDAAQFWDLDIANCLPRVPPEYPVVDMEHPHILCFSLSEGRHTMKPDAITWMVKVDLKKKNILDFAGYSEISSRMMSEGLSFMSTEMLCYLSTQTVKRRAVSRLET